MNQNFGQLGKRMVKFRAHLEGAGCDQNRCRKPSWETFSIHNPTWGLPIGPSLGVGTWSLDFRLPPSQPSTHLRTGDVTCVLHLSEIGASAFFRHYSFALRHSPCSNPTPEHLDFLPVAPVSSTPPVRLAPASSSFQSNQSGPNSTKPELSGANWTKTAFWLAAARSTRSTNGKARIA
jgi:hypothetical protein